MGVSNAVIGVVVALFIAGIMLPPALNAMNGTGLNGVDSNVTTIFTVLLPVLGVIAVALILLKRAS